MYELYPYFTNDGSVGLFSPEADDIYHSTYGALTEAYEKFIIPSNLNNFNKKEIKVLDICFGIGYNTKAFLNSVLKNEVSRKNKNIKNTYSGTIGSNNICNDKLYTDNNFSKISITALDNDKILANLSPFFITGKKNIKNNAISFKQEKIQKMLSKNTKPQFILDKEINIILLEKLYKIIDSDVEDILSNKKYSNFFDNSIINLYRLKKQNMTLNTPLKRIKAFLHNIYYKYLSRSHKNALNILKNREINFDLKIDDARISLKNDNNRYDYIFLDAFTPAKCPCLWTLEFFQLLYEHLEDDGMILTYSNSAIVRNTFLQAGFFVGKIFSERTKKFTGTVAVKNKTLIKYELSEYDLGLLKTKAGIIYHDENLNLDNEAIISAHDLEVENSNLISSSKYIKTFKNKK